LIAVGVLALPALGAPTAGAQEPTAITSAVPTPAAPRPGKPTTVAAIGDSITQSTGTGPLSKEYPENSWATGCSFNSLAARLGIPTNKRYNYSANGNRMTHFVSEVNNGKSGGSGDVAPMPSDIGLVLVEMGGNDLCRDSVADMTSVTDYRNQFKAGLAAVTAKAPSALIQVMSIPDIYNLWYIRGAIQDPTYHPEPESDQASGINGARFYWDGLTGLGVKFPCQSLLSMPGSTAKPDRDRRLEVRQRTKDFNQVLAEECAKVLRCKFDDKQLFNWSSNRENPPDGRLWPQPYWNLTDQDISRNTISGCPLTGLTGSGCGDHFHPSKQGQGKIADMAWIYGRDYTDTTYPLAGGSVLPSTRPDGIDHGRATVRFTGSDNAGLRGQEVRVHNPDGSVTGWSQHVGIAPDRVIDKVGMSYVEVRSLDVNGNLSGGTLIPVLVEVPLLPGAPSTPTLSASANGVTIAWKAPADDGGGSILRYDLDGFVGAPPASTGSPTPVTTGLSAPAPAGPAGTVSRWTVAAVNSSGAGASSPPSAATVVPFGSLGAFVDRQYRDFMGRAPTAAETLTAVSKLDAGTVTPASFIDQLRASTWFDGAYGPAIRLYRAYFLRLPDPTGLDYWAAKRREGRTLSKMSQQFSVSSEFQNRYGALTDAEFIDKIYNNVFFRDPDPAGRDYYLRRLKSGWSRGQVVLQFSESSEDKRQAKPVVDVVEFCRGMNGRAPDQIETEYRLLDYNTKGGAEGVVATLVSASSYRTRIFG